MFQFEAVFFKEIVFQGRVKMHETAGNRASRNAQANWRFTRLGKEGISVNLRGEQGEQAAQRAEELFNRPCGQHRTFLRLVY